MPLPQPEGFEDRFLALERKVNDLFTSIQNRGGVTTASAGLIFPSRDVPDAPPDGGHLYAEGNDPYWQDASGSNRAIIQDFPQGVAVPNPPTMTATLLGSGVTVLGADYNKLGNDIADLRDNVIALENSLRGGTIIDI